MSTEKVFEFRPRLRDGIDNRSIEYAVQWAKFSLEADDVNGVEEPGRLPTITVWLKLVGVHRYMTNTTTGRRERRFACRVRLEDSGYPAIGSRLRFSPRGRRYRLVNWSRLRLAGRKAVEQLLR